MKPPQGLDAAFEDDPHGVRDLLRGLPEPGPMPDAVADRIRDALAQESGHRETSRGRLHDVDLSDNNADADPTGMRDLLASQPDPGPMPDALSDRIMAALSAERSAEERDQSRVSELLADLPDPGPMPDIVAKRIVVAIETERTALADADPTGMRDLLASQPDPGPMPAAVSDRIAEALRREAAGLERPQNVTALRSSGSSSSSTRGSAPATERRGMLRLVAGAAAAAVAGVVAFGALQSMSNDAPPTQAGTSTASSDSVAEKVHVTSTDKNYTAASFRTDAGALAKADVASGLSTADASRLGSVATPEGALSCAAAIGKDVVNGANRITVDIAAYENKPALIVVTTKDGKSTGWVLSRSCDTNQTPVAGPTDID